MEIEFPEDDLLVQSGCTAVTAVIGQFTAGGYAAVWHQYLDKTPSGWVVIGELMKELSKKEAPAVEPKKFKAAPSHVGVVIGRTVNMGDYESVKVGVLLIEPCAHDKRDEVYKDAVTWVSNRVQAEVDEAVEAREEMEKKRRGGRR